MKSNTCAYANTHLHRYMSTQTHMNIHLYRYTNTYAHINIHTYIHKYKSIQTHLYAQAQVLFFKFFLQIVALFQLSETENGHQKRAVGRSPGVWILG